MTPHKYDEHEQYQTKKDLRNQLMPNFNFKNLWYVKFHVIPANRIYPGWVQDFQTELNDLLTTYSKQNPQFKSFVGILCYDHEEGWYRFHLFSTRQPDDVIIENHIVKSKKSLTIDYLTYTTQGTPEPEYVFQF